MKRIDPISAVLIVACVFILLSFEFCDGQTYLH